MADTLPPIVVALRATIGDFKAKMGEAGAEAKSFGDKSKSSFGAASHVGKLALAGIAGGAIAVGGESLKMGISFQEATTRLVTGAGESETNIEMVRQGLLKMAPAVGMGPEALAKAMFLVNSAGFHGAEGLNVMQAAAEGAKIGGADATVVADGLTTALTDYHLPADQAATVTSKLVQTVADGKTNMQDLSGALSGVMPFAAQFGIGMNDMLGAMATMTSQGISAATSSTNLKFTIMSLANETPKGAKALKDVGLSAGEVNQDLKSKGLMGTLQAVTDAVGKKFPAGSAEYTHAIASIVGGTRGMGATLALTGKNMDTYKANIQNIGEAATETGNHVQGWGKTQADLGTKIDQAKAGVAAMGVTIGMALIPWVEKAITIGTEWAHYFSEHKGLLLAVAGVIGGALVFAITAYVAHLAMAAVKTTVEFAKMIEAGAKWVAKHTAQLATWIAENTAAFTTWVAEQSAAMAEAAAKWAAYTAAWLAEQATAMATWVAESTAATATWIAEQAAALATSIAGAVVWSASLLASAATAAAGWLISMAGMAATAIASAAAMILPFLPLILTIGLIGIAAYELYEHWDTVWGFIKRIASDTWDFLRMIFGYIVEGGLWLIKTEVQGLENVWGAVWGGITNTVSGVWNFLRGIFNDIVQGGVWFIKTEIQGLENTWSAVWSGITGTVAWAWDFISSVFGNIGRSVSWVLGVIGSVASAASNVGGLLSHIPGFAGGVTNFGGGLAMVGENGPELVNLPRGSDVVSAGKTASMVGTGRPVGGIGGGGGNVTNIVHVHVAGGIYGQGGEAALTDHIHEGLLRKQARSPLGIMATA